MQYKDTISYLYSRLPMFHRIGAAAYKPNLDNTIALIKILDHPERQFKSIHVAGTNGKGSVSHMLAAIFQKCGYKTGLYTSPHLVDFRERVRVNGEMIPEERVIAFVEKYKEKFEPIGLSFFEWTVGLAFDYFANENVDIAIIETGLGGRLDSTNVISPELSIITNISYDHMALLGNTLEKIAIEKAGIIKAGIPVVIGERQSETESVFSTIAKHQQSELVFSSDHYSAHSVRIDNHLQQLTVLKDGDHFADVLIDLPGIYQNLNCCTVMQSVEVMRKKGYDFPDEKIYNALVSVKKLTGLRGRWETLSDQPLIICDVGHNKAGIEFIVKQLSLIKYRQLHFIIGMVNDKDIASVLELLPRNAIYYFTKANLPRALDETLLYEAAAKFDLKGNVYPTVDDAMSSAKNNASDDDLIFVGGSTFVVAEAITGLQK
jgi:dihydrofolate synthase / folylpolyglutamate synthase